MQENRDENNTQASKTSNLDPPPLHRLPLLVLTKGLRTRAPTKHARARKANGDQHRDANQHQHASTEPTSVPPPPSRM